MKFKTFKKKLKNSELVAYFNNKDSVSYFWPWNRRKGYFVVIGTDYDGEAWDCYISIKDLKKYIKRYKFKKFKY